jgi:hypothetical protein
MLLLLTALLCAAKEALPYTAEAQAFIEAWQNPSTCSGRAWVASTHVAGIGSEIHVSTGVLAWAINHGALFTWPRTTQWTNDTWCGSEQRSYECAFVPPTNCSQEMLDPARRVRAGDFQGSVPTQFKNVSVEPYPLLYWWRAQAAAYLTRLNDRFRVRLEALRQKYLPARLPCGSVCVYVRHGDKGSEMELLPWARFLTGVKVAIEQLSARPEALHCRPTRAPVFLMTDDRRALADAKRDFGSRLWVVNESIPASALPHEHGGNASAASKWENFEWSMLNLEICVEADAFVSQRLANFARLVDELRMTRYGRLGQPFIELGKYQFGWKRNVN